MRIQNDWTRSEFASPRLRAVAYATKACVAIEHCLPLGKLKMSTPTTNRLALEQNRLGGALART